MIEGYHSAKCKVWRASGDVNVKNHDLGRVIAQSCIHKTRGTENQGHEVKVCQFRVKCEESKLRILKVTQGL